MQYCSSAPRRRNDRAVDDGIITEYYSVVLSRFDDLITIIYQYTVLSIVLIQSFFFFFQINLFQLHRNYYFVVMLNVPSYSKIIKPTFPTQDVRIISISPSNILPHSHY